MRYSFLRLVGLALLAPAVMTHAAPLAELAVHYAMRSDATPVIDGVLDEPGWRQAPEFSRYRNGSGSHHQKTSIRILWDDKGICFGVINTEANLDRIKADARTRDSDRVWGDDSGEFYLDPTATGYSMFKFDVNSLGTVSDFWQVDMGFTDFAWSAPSARAAGGRTADAWTVEFFVAWADLKKTAAAGDVWKFFHRRLAYTSPTGAISDSSTSGGHWFKREFGYIFFCDAKVPEPQELGSKLARLAAPPWVLPLAGPWLFAETAQSVLLQNPGEIIQKLRSQAQGALTAVKGTGDRQLGEAERGKLGKLEERLSAADQDALEFNKMKAYKAIADDAARLADDISLGEFMK